MIKALKFLLGFIALIAYELFLDGSGIGMKQRWSKLKNGHRNKEGTYA